MEAFIGAVGVCFILRGIFTFVGRGLPKNVIEKMQDPKIIRGWYQGTGIVHILWGACAILIWYMNQFPKYSFYALAAMPINIICPRRG
ncbi:hypothetical protein [Paramuribaculum intestinale]|uniref:hypothetical protein n=1 Tax=Paramuribaculum intestinale TaxID=2094151 RepID=UPI00272B42DB|nr:hypothetical protein [Paramuribaculum intestinale]